MIVCILKSRQNSCLIWTFFEVDMSYKRIGKSDLNEVVFATFLRSHGKSIIYGSSLDQMLMELCCSNNSLSCFHRAGRSCQLLPSLQKGIRNRFPVNRETSHIHEGGVNTLRLGFDMDKKQMKGQRFLPGLVALDTYFTQDLTFTWKL